MDPTLIARYQSGGDIYAALAAKYGQAAADAAAAAAQTGDETAINSAIATAVYGAPLDTSTISIFTQQIETNPLGAPLSSLNNVFGNTFASLLKSPYVIGAVVIAGFIYLGDLELIASKIKPKN